MTIATAQLAELRPHPSNVRERYDGNEMKQLIESVRHHGVIEPLLVRPIWQQTVPENGREEQWEVDHYQVVAGHRRLRAAEAVGLAQAPIVVREMDDVEALQAMLVENLQRVDLTPIEEARGYLRLTDTGMTVKDLAGKIGRSQKHVSSRLKLLSAPGWLIDLLQNGSTTLGDFETYQELAADIEKKYADLLAELPSYDELQTDLAVEYDRGGPRGAARLFESSCKYLKREQMVNEIRSKAESKGFVFVEMERNTQGWGLKWPAGVAPVEDLIIDVKSHRKEPCHALGLNESSAPPKVVELCERRSRHTKSGASELKPADLDKRVEQRAKAKEEKEQRAAAELALLERMRRTVAEAKPTQLRDLAAVFLSCQPFNSAVDDKVAHILGVFNPEESNLSAIDAYADESSTNRARVAAAYALVVGWDAWARATPAKTYARALVDDISGPDSEQPPG